MLKQLKRTIRKIVILLIPYRFIQIMINFLLKLNTGGGDLTLSGERGALKYARHVLNRIYPDISNLVLFDVGANKGYYSKELIGQFGENAVIYAFEPLPSTYKMLEENVMHFPAINTYPFGFSDKSCTLTMYTDKEGSGMASVYNRNLSHFDIDMKIRQDCNFTTIDEFCSLNSVDHINYLKIDVEGHELSVLQGAKKMIDNSRIDYIQFEFGGCNINSRTFFQDFWYLLSDIYDIYKIVPNGLVKVKQYQEQYEIFICTNYLAELKKHNV